MFYRTTHALSSNHINKKNQDFDKVQMMGHFYTFKCDSLNHGNQEHTEIKRMSRPLNSYASLGAMAMIFIIQIGCTRNRRKAA